VESVTATKTESNSNQKAKQTTIILIRKLKNN